MCHHREQHSEEIAKERAMWIPTALENREIRCGSSDCAFLQLHDERVHAFRKEPNLPICFVNSAKRVIPHVIKKKKKKVYLEMTPFSGQDVASKCWSIY